MRKNKMAYISILVFLICTEGIASAVSKIEKTYGSYQVTLSKDLSTDEAHLSIAKGKQTVFEEIEIGSTFYLGNKFDEKTENKEIYTGRKITSSQDDNLIITKWTGGAHCCNYLYIFELSIPLKKIAYVEAGSSSIKLKNLDNDDSLEIEFFEGAIDYQFASYAGSPPGRVVLKFSDGQYRVSEHLMRKPLPNEGKLKGLKLKAIKGFKKVESSELPYDFLEPLMNMSYTGHLKYALQFVDEVWPSKKPGKEKFKHDFEVAINSSTYWPFKQGP